MGKKRRETRELTWWGKKVSQAEYGIVIVIYWLQQEKQKQSKKETMCCFSQYYLVHIKLSLFSLQLLHEGRAFWNSCCTASGP